MALINYNGTLQPADQPVAITASRGLRYGDGLFETIYVSQRTPRLLHDHFNRLILGMELLKMNRPRFWDLNWLYHEISRVLQGNQNPPFARIRLGVWRGNGGLFDRDQLQPQFVLECWELDEATGAYNSNGLWLHCFEDAVKTCDRLSNVKHSNFLPYVMGAIAAQEARCNDSIILNQFGRISDTCVANLFAVTNGIVYTPSLSEGCVAGVMRNRMVQFLADQQMQVEEGPLTIDDLLLADEVFLTNAIHPVRWVRQFRTKEYMNLFSARIYSQFRATIS